jgi:hypothetical protein
MIPRLRRASRRSAGHRHYRLAALFALIDGHSHRHVARDAQMLAAAIAEPQNFPTY